MNLRVAVLFFNKDDVVSIYIYLIIIINLNVLL